MQLTKLTNLSKEVFRAIWSISIQFWSTSKKKLSKARPVDVLDSARVMKALDKMVKLDSFWDTPPSCARESANLWTTLDKMVKNNTLWEMTIWRRCHRRID